MYHDALLALADGTFFWGNSVGSPGVCTAEIVFNTSMTGYQEVLTDPSYAQQIVTFTYPHIGNTGINTEDNEAGKIWPSGVVLRDLPYCFSNWRARKSLPAWLQEHNTPAICNIDTRYLTQIIRKQGNLGACLMAGEVNSDYALKQARQYIGLINVDLAKTVTTSSIYQWRTGKSNSKLTNEALPYHVVAYDFGIKRSILHKLVDLGCDLTIVPAQTTAAEVFSLQPDGILLSNGPGDPMACTYAVEVVKAILEKNIPLFAICLGYQLLALASGADTVKMLHGHHGTNHPVINLENRRVSISSQNHGFTIAEKNLPKCLKITHRSLFDNTIQGIARIDKPAFGFQGHPEGGPGPEELANLFSHFIQLICEQHAKI